MGTWNWLGISKVLLIAASPIAIAATFLGLLLIAGDPASDRTPARIAHDNQLHHRLGLIIGPVFLGAWLLIFLTLRWHSRLREQWNKEGAADANPNIAHH